MILLIDHTCLGNVCNFYFLGRNQTKEHQTLFLTFVYSICSIKSAMKGTPDASWKVFFSTFVPHSPRGMLFKNNKTLLCFCSNFSAVPAPSL